MTPSKFMHPACLAISLCLSLFSSLASAWEIKAGFENGTVGDIAQSPNPDAFHTQAGESFYVDSPVLSGNQSGSVFIFEDNFGPGRWGGVFNFPTALGEGESVWYRVNVYFPTDWSFYCNDCPDGVRFMSVRTELNDDLEGYIRNHLHSESSDGSGGQIKPNNELYGSPADSLGTVVQRNQWYTYEMQITFSSVSGEGVYRIWQDGELIFEDTTTPTLTNSTSTSHSARLFTLWENKAPRTQTAYVDDIVITNEVPGRIDANGNPFIGVGPAINTPPPPPPPPAPAPSGVFFEDGFESNDLSHSQNGFRWTSVVSGDVNSVNANSGNHSFEFIFPASSQDAFSELNFDLGGSYTELWIAYDLYIPDNYYHRDIPSEVYSDNNKGFLYLWSGDYGSPSGPGLGPNNWPLSDGSTKASFYAWGPGWDRHLWDAMPDAISTSDNGTWVRMTMHYKYATEANNDGVAEIWRTRGDGTTTKLLDIHDGEWYVPGQPGFDQGYILGWANSGFPSETRFYIDNVQVSTSSLFSNDYYVAYDGTATWEACTDVNTPCSAQTAMANAEAGDTVHFLGGTYDITGDYTPEHGILEPVNSGTIDKPIIFQAYQNEEPIIRVNCTSSSNLCHAIGTNAKDYII